MVTTPVRDNLDRIAEPLDDREIARRQRSMAGKLGEQLGVVARDARADRPHAACAAAMSPIEEELVVKTPGQIAYEADCAIAPTYHDGTPRKSERRCDDGSGCLSRRMALVHGRLRWPL
jgi:hypothetical protein